MEQFSAHEREELTETGISQEGRPIVPSSGYEDPLHYEDPVIHISGTGHWFLEGWIGNHSVEFLVDLGSSVTAMSDIFYRGLVQAGAPVGALQITARTLRSANGTGIEVLGCSRCSVSFLGLRTEFPIIVCSLAAFATHSGLFQFRVMPFGLCNAPATFERLMDQVLQGLRWNRCLVYLDDIISFGGTFGAALSNLTLIFERLRSYGLQLKSSKCHLFRASVPFLGHIVGRRGLECDPKKIEDVKSWPVPDCLRSVRQFLGFVGYYRRFIPKFADIVTPLVYLTGKDVPFVWDTSCSAAFQELRASLIDAPILAFPTETGQYILDTDASNFGLGGVLSQMQNDQE